MDDTQYKLLRALLRTVFLAGIAGVAFAGPLEVFPKNHHGVERPAASEFGTGPRNSIKQTYSVTLQPTGPFRLRQMQTVNIQVLDSRGVPVEDAAIAVDGGMPEHNHGLPTRPRVKRALGAGLYEIEGLRFSMGGWWELKLGIESPRGADQVVFNLSL